jgi:hypothetical protein
LREGWGREFKRINGGGVSSRGQRGEKFIKGGRNKVLPEIEIVFGKIGESGPVGS